MTNQATVDFFIYSPPKTGSTSLFKYLSSHPQLDACATKEPQYFSQLCNTHPLDWYNGLFSSDSRLKFEASSTYFGHNTAIDNIKHFCKPDVKFIVVLRNPVDRFVSNYIHFKSHNIILNNTHLYDTFVNDPQNSPFIDEWITESKKFVGISDSLDTILSNPHHILIHWSKYYQPMKKLLSITDRSNILFIQYEQFRKNNQQHIDRICDFLHINHFLIQESLTYNSSDFWKQYVNTIECISIQRTNQLKQIFTDDILSLENLLGIQTQWI